MKRAFGATDAGASRAAGERHLQQVSSLLNQRQTLAADDALTAAPPWLRKTPAWALLRGVVDTRLGRVDAAEAVLRPLVDGPEPWATEACSALGDLYHFTRRTDALRELLARDSPWARSPRGALFAARVQARDDPERALAGLLALVDAAPGAELRRIAGFDAVQLLDRLARYPEAHALAVQLHAAAPAFDAGGLVAGLRLQERLLAKGPGWCSPRTGPVDDTAFIVGMPRSGTTLIEQMLDRHPAIAGIGEHEGVGSMVRGVISAGAWPYRMNHLAAPVAARLQQDYRRTARRRARDGAAWTLDKSLLTWQWLPAIAAVLPGAVGLHIVRDARDMAISAFLSHLDPFSFGWAASLESIRQVVAAERALVPLALQTLGIGHESIVYERLVADPAGHLARCLARLGLPMDARVLAPELNTRTAMTLSHEQVRRPVNDASIGRWRHYAFAFESAAWDALATPAG